MTVTVYVKPFQFGVIASVGTSVSIRFSKSVDFYYNRVRYTNLAANDPPFALLMRQYELFHFEDMGDLTGTSIESTSGHKVAVFAGVWYDRATEFEQQISPIFTVYISCCTFA